MCVTSMRLSIVLFLMLASLSVLLHHVINSRWAKSVKPIFYIGGKEIEYVEEWPLLGNLVHANGSDQKDINNKTNTLCGQINNVRCYFGKRDPITKLRLMRSYCSSLYGLSLIHI